MKSRRMMWLTAGCLFGLLLNGCGDSKSPTPSGKTGKTTPADKTGEKTDGKTVDGGGKAAATEGWGHLKGRFVLKGTPPTLPEINVTADGDYCLPFKESKELRNETVVVGKEGGLQNVIIYLRTKKPRVHASYEADAKGTVTVDNHKCRFNQHVTLLRTTQSLEIKNSDPKGHNTKLDSGLQGFNELIPPGKSTTKMLTQEESVPVPWGCNIHPWMKGHLLVRDNPYMAVSGNDGSFEIKNLPAGELEFQLWHEVNQYLKLDGWGSNGRKKFVIEPGEKTTDLGTIDVPAELVTPQ